MNGESIGVFATRSPHRPNPIGLSLVEIIKIEKDKIIFAGADLVDGTPVLDIKPYLPQFENQPQAKGGWSVESEQKNIGVEFSETAEIELQKWMDQTGRHELREVVVQTLKQDPRPVIYKGYESSESPYRNKHAFRLYDGDIHFEFLSADHARVFQIRFETKD
jgi:tRNA (adenine37-N6)-methyltransferase